MKATDLLKQQHQVVNELFERFESADESEREEICDELAKNLAAHSSIEKEIMYPACTEFAPDLILHSLEEHAAQDFLVRRLLEVEATDESVEAKIEVLKKVVQDHVEEEERELLPGAESLGDERLEQLGDEMEARFEELLEEDPRTNIEASLGITVKAARRRRAPARKRARASTARKAPRTKRATRRARPQAKRGSKRGRASR